MQQRGSADLAAAKRRHGVSEGAQGRAGVLFVLVQLGKQRCRSGAGMQRLLTAASAVAACTTPSCSWASAGFGIIVFSN